MKILLIAPPDNKTVDPFLSAKAPPTPIFQGFPLSIGYLASSLEQSGFHPKIIDCLAQNLSQDNLEKRIAKIKPDVVGITTMTHYIRSAIKVADTVKKINPKTIVIGGGPHIHFDYQNLLQNYKFDYIVRGEGEITIVKLLKYLKTKRGRLDHIQGIAYRRHSKIITTPPRPLIKNLDSLPFPSRHLVDFNSYIVDQLLPNAVEIVGSRGCSHRCAFCSSSHFWQIWRPRSPENIIKELKQLIKTYPKIKSFLFYDDNFTVDPKRVKKLCRLLIANHLNHYQWNCQARFDQVDYNMLKLMKKAGVSKINFGLESGSEKIIKNINKRLQLDTIKKTVKIARQLGIETLVYMMVGNPGETPKTIQQSVNFIKKIKPTSTLWSVTQVLPGTQLHQLQPIKDYVNYLYRPELDHPYPYTWSFIPVFQNKLLNREQVKYHHLHLSRYFAFYHFIHDPISKIKHVLVSPYKSLRYLFSLIRPKN